MSPLKACRLGLLRPLGYGLVWLWTVFAAQAVWAVSSEFCDDAPALNAIQSDHLLSFASLVRNQLDQHPQNLALISRSGLNLALIGQRYSHSGWTQHLDEPNSAWEVRQLYYACQDQRPRLFDQGLSAFVKGTHDPDLGFVSLVWLPLDASAVVTPRIVDKPTALAMLGTDYSANAYPFSGRYQNCNQWTLEMLAPSENRAQAQAWLQAQHYTPSRINLYMPPLLWLSQLSPWLHTDDHPDSDWDKAQFSVSLPESLEAFVHQQWPSAERVELCHTRSHVVIHTGWTSVSDDCQAGPGDTLVSLESIS